MFRSNFFYEYRKFEKVLYGLNPSKIIFFFMDPAPGIILDTNPCQNQFLESRIPLRVEESLDPAV